MGNYYAVLMFIFAGVMFLMGIYVYTGHQDLIPKLYEKKDKKYLEYLGKSVMLAALSPFLSALASYTGSVLIALAVFVVTFILAMIIGNKIFKK